MEVMDVEWLSADFKTLLGYSVDGIYSNEMKPQSFYSCYCIAWGVTSVISFCYPEFPFVCLDAYVLSDY